MEPDVKPRRRGTAKKILAVAAVCVLAALGGVFAAVAPALPAARLNPKQAPHCGHRRASLPPLFRP
ncbi:hypothetical protein OUO20_02975 [Arthrobacter sp. FX8]|uniref:hypothetical protein n=1 Tax=Arthrobacter sp. FX8 TaxID=2997335 RepID=UPI00227BDC23|nr:hypothetical protein [Arthrobacter sp. FX8]WAJ33982.1 hypothetical protein OUO20_02975 [Arthrobacter sp. FX8]